MVGGTKLSRNLGELGLHAWWDIGLGGRAGRGSGSWRQSKTGLGEVKGWATEKTTGNFRLWFEGLRV